MEAQERGGFEDDRGTDQPARAHEQRTHAGDDAISEAEIGRTFPGAIEDQQLVLDEHGFGHHGTGAAGTGEPGDRRQQMQKQDGQIAHRPIVASSRNPRNAHGFRNSPCTASSTKRLAIRHAHVIDYLAAGVPGSSFISAPSFSAVSR